MSMHIEILTETEVNAILRTLSPRWPTTARNRALIALLYRTGLRCAEALALRPQDVDLVTGTVRVHHGKGDVARTVGIDAGAAPLIRHWLTRRRAGDGPLFCTRDGRPLGTRYVRRMVARIAAKAGVAKRVHPHGFRHTHAAELAREGVPLNVIQRQLGHSNIGTTSRYLDHISPQQVIDAIGARQWQAA